MNELQVLSDDCRYLVLLAKVQSKVDKNEEALLSLERVSPCAASDSFLSSTESFTQLVYLLLGINQSIVTRHGMKLNFMSQNQQYSLGH